MYQYLILVSVLKINRLSGTIIITVQFCSGSTSRKVDPGSMKRKAICSLEPPIL